MRRLPPLGALEAFVVVAQRQGLKPAAADLSLSPSALSRRVQALETHVGRKLFDRLNGAFRLTRDGEQLLDHVTPAFERLGRAIEELRGEEAEVRLGVMPAFANAWLMPRLAQFKAAHPGLRLTLDTGSRDLTRLGTAIEAAIVIADQSQEGLYSRRLCQQMLVAVCSPALREGRPPLRGPEDIAAHTFLVHRHMPELLEVWRRGIGVAARPERIDYYDSGPMLLEAASLGLGVALVFNTMVPPAEAGARLVRPFDERIESPLNYWFFCRPGALASRPLRQFHDWLFAQIVPGPESPDAAAMPLMPG